MLQATEQQLRVVEAKTAKLEASLSTQIDDVRRLKDERSRATEEVTHLESMLQAARERAQVVVETHEEAAARLKQMALEYSKAQLLQKKYSNTLAELQGGCRSIVRMVGVQGAAASSVAAGPFVVADECTVNALQQRKSFVFDGVIADDTSQESALQLMGLDGMASDCLAGYSTGMFTFGPASSGKTTLLFGGGDAENGASPQPPRGGPVSGISGGIVGSFLRTLFAAFEANEVTHFNIRCTFAEIEHENVIDLLSDFGDVVSFGGRVSDARALPVQSLSDALSHIRGGLSRVKQHRHAMRRSHLVLSFLVENFNTRGHFRRSNVTFVDLAGATPSNAGPDAVWINKGIAALCDVIAMRASESGQQEGQRIPHSTNRVVSVLEDMLAGRAKALMLCCASAITNTNDEVLGALSVAYHFKKVRNAPVPYDIPPELQRLHMEMNSFGENDNQASVSQQQQQQQQLRQVPMNGQGAMPAQLGGRFHGHDPYH